MLHAKNVPGRFWAEAMKTAAFVINRLPQQRLNFSSPFENLWNIMPTVSYFQVFGCVCYVFVLIRAQLVSHLIHVQLVLLD